MLNFVVLSPVFYLYAECCFVMSLCWMSLCWVSWCHDNHNGHIATLSIKLCWVLHFIVMLSVKFWLLCRVSLCGVSLCRVSWRQKIGIAGRLTPSNTCSSLNLMTTCQRVPRPFDIILITFLQASNPKTAFATHPVIGVNEVGSRLHLSSSQNN